MPLVSAETKKLLTLSAIQGVGAKSLYSFSKLNNFSDLSVKELLDLTAIKDVSSKDLELAESFAQFNIDCANERNHKIISFFDKSFPYNFKNMNDAPAILYCAGNISTLNQKSIAIIGTREPTEHGKIIAKNITTWFASRNWCVVSGLAKGVDYIAHETTMNVSGTTVAVMAQGLNKVYPAENRKLSEDILDRNGALISEYSYNSQTFRNNFVQRDRIQAGLAAGVIMVQSDLKGGSLHASRAILKYGGLLIVPNQSVKDMTNNELKIQANLVFLNNEKNKISQLLKINSVPSNKILIMKGKDDYLSVEDSLMLNMNSQLNSIDSGFGF